MSRQCVCGVGSVTLIPAGEDLWDVRLDNATGKRRNGRREYQCDDCGRMIDYADPAMIASEHTPPTSEGEK